LPWQINIRALAPHFLKIAEIHTVSIQRQGKKVREAVCAFLVSQSVSHLVLVSGKMLLSYEVYRAGKASRHNQIQY